MAFPQSEDGDVCEIVGGVSYSGRSLPDGSQSAFYGSRGRRWTQKNANCGSAAFAVVMEVAYDRLGMLPCDDSPLGKLFAARIGSDVRSKAAAMAEFHQECVRVTAGDRTGAVSTIHAPHLACSTLFQKFGALVGTSGPAYDAGREHCAAFVAPFARLSFRPGDLMADAIESYIGKRNGHIPKLIQVDVGRLVSDDQDFVIAPVNVRVTGRSSLLYQCCGALYGNGQHWKCTVTCSQDCTWEYDSVSDGSLRQVHSEAFAWPRRCKKKEGYGPSIFVYVLQAGEKARCLDTPTAATIPESPTGSTRSIRAVSSAPSSPPPVRNIRSVSSEDNRRAVEPLCNPSGHGRGAFVVTGFEREVTVTIMFFLGPADLGSCSLACRTWHGIIYRMVFGLQADRLRVSRRVERMREDGTMYESTWAEGLAERAEAERDNQRRAIHEKFEKRKSEVGYLRAQKELQDEVANGYGSMARFLQNMFSDSDSSDDEIVSRGVQKHGSEVRMRRRPVEATCNPGDDADVQRDLGPQRPRGDSSSVSVGASLVFEGHPHTAFDSPRPSRRCDSDGESLAGSNKADDDADARKELTANDPEAEALIQWANDLEAEFHGLTETSRTTKDPATGEGLPGKPDQQAQFALCRGLKGSCVCNRGASDRLELGCKWKGWSRCKHPPCGALLPPLKLCSAAGCVQRRKRKAREFLAKKPGVDIVRLPQSSAGTGRFLRDLVPKQPRVDSSASESLVFEGNPIKAFGSPPAHLRADSPAQRFAGSSISCATPTTGVGRCPTRSHEPLTSPSGAIAGLRSMLKGPPTMVALCAMPITDGYELVNGCRPPLLPHERVNHCVVVPSYPNGHLVEDAEHRPYWREYDLTSHLGAKLGPVQPVGTAAAFYREEFQTAVELLKPVIREATGTDFFSKLTKPRPLPRGWNAVTEMWPPGTTGDVFVPHDRVGFQYRCDYQRNSGCPVILRVMREHGRYPRSAVYSVQISTEPHRHACNHIAAKGTRKDGLDKRYPAIHPVVDAFIRSQARADTKITPRKLKPRIVKHLQTTTHLHCRRCHASVEQEAEYEKEQRKETPICFHQFVHRDQAMLSGHGMSAHLPGIVETPSGKHTEDRYVGVHHMVVEDGHAISGSAAMLDLQQNQIADKLRQYKKEFGGEAILNKSMPRDGSMGEHFRALEEENLFLHWDRCVREKKVNAFDVYEWRIVALLYTDTKPDIVQPKSPRAPNAEDVRWKDAADVPPPRDGTDHNFVAVYASFASLMTGVKAWSLRHVSGGVTVGLDHMYNCVKEVPNVSGWAITGGSGIEHVLCLVIAIIRV